MLEVHALIALQFFLMSVARIQHWAEVERASLERRWLYMLA